jgi:hypothetical protein
VARHTIACNDNELVVVSQVMSDDVRVGGDDLRFRGELRIFLVLKIAEGTRECKITCSGHVSTLANSRLSSTNRSHGHTLRNRQQLRCAASRLCRCSGMGYNQRTSSLTVVRRLVVIAKCLDFAI